MLEKGTLKVEDLKEGKGEKIIAIIGDAQSPQSKYNLI